jgi:hypothetical protein
MRAVAPPGRDATGTIVAARERIPAVDTSCIDGTLRPCIPGSSSTVAARVGIVPPVLPVHCGTGPGQRAVFQGKAVDFGVLPALLGIQVSQPGFPITLRCRRARTRSQPLLAIRSISPRASPGRRRPRLDRRCGPFAGPAAARPIGQRDRAEQDGRSTIRDVSGIIAWLMASRGLSPFSACRRRAASQMKRRRTPDPASWRCDSWSLPLYL